MFSLFFSGYKRYPMYPSPLTERIRKRRTFADNELNSSTDLLSATAAANASSSTSSSSYRSIPTFILNENSSSLCDATTSSFGFVPKYGPYEFCNYLRSRVLHSPYTNTHLNSLNDELPKIRIIDESKLRDCNLKFNFNLDTSLLDSCSTKPKLSFSIESIIGIK